MFMFLNLAIWNEHQSKIDMVHKLLRSSQDKLEEQIKMRNEQVSVVLYLVYFLIKIRHINKKKFCIYWYGLFSE